jgi:hypothetical protein
MKSSLILTVLATSVLGGAGTDKINNPDGSYWESSGGDSLYYFLTNIPSTKTREQACADNIGIFTPKRVCEIRWYVFNYKVTAVLENRPK